MEYATGKYITKNGDILDIPTERVCNTDRPLITTYSVGTLESPDCYGTYEMLEHAEYTQSCQASKETENVFIRSGSEIISWMNP